MGGGKDGKGRRGRKWMRVEGRQTRRRRRSYEAQGLEEDAEVKLRRERRRKNIK